MRNKEKKYDNGILNMSPSTMFKIIFVSLIIITVFCAYEYIKVDKKIKQLEYDYTVVDSTYIIK